MGSTEGTAQDLSEVPPISKATTATEGRPNYQIKHIYLRYGED